MSQAKDLVVRLKALDGSWEACGTDRARGIIPENVAPSANGWGSDKVSFDLRRDPKAIWPDLGAFTPVKIEIGGVLVWAGRIKETPSRDSADRVVSVQCEGWQYHLDDDVYEHAYVHNRLSDWKDMRSSLTADLTKLNAVGQVSSGDGSVTLSWPQGQVVPANCVTGIMLDLGPGSAAKRVVVEWDSSATSGTFFVRGADSSAWPQPSGYEDAVFNAAMTASQTSAGTFVTARRYIAVFIYVGTGSLTPAADVWAKIKSIKVFAETAYESGNASILKGPVVIGDALDRATVLLSSDRSQIDPAATVAFNIPSLAPGEPRTPREMWEAVNAYHDYQSKIDVLGRPVFVPKPSRARYVVGAWSPMEFEDAAANSGDEIYNRVIVTAQTPDGSQLRVERTAGQQPGVIASPSTSPAPDNPTFATDAASWTAGGGSVITRDTTVFDSAPASGRWDKTGAADNLPAGATLTETFTGTFLAGVNYQLIIRVMPGTPNGALNVAFGKLGVDYTESATPIEDTTTRNVVLSWTPSQNRTGVQLQLVESGAGGGGIGFYRIDGLSLSTAQPTLVDRRGFRRAKILQVRAPLPADGVAAAQIGDTWLAGHKLTPFKGTIKLTGDTAVRDRLTGAPVPLERLLLATGELLEFNDRPDHDTGSHGRVGRIATVTYDHAKNEATVALDNTRAGFEALLERLAVVTGS